MSATRRGDNLYPEIEEKLRLLAAPVPVPEAGDWLAEHPESGQTFQEYLDANPVRRGPRTSAIYLCELGDFSAAQQRVVDATREYLAVFFDVPVHICRHVPLSDIPARARRINPHWGQEQVLSTYVLRELLTPDRPRDALAYLALTAADLWPGKGWNFVFGQANLRQRVGVWSIHRNGDPDEGADAYRLCLRRALMTASHETGHILTMKHCISHHCLMNGSNHQEERDARPIHLCPVCLRKLLWNLQAEPLAYLRRVEGFCRAHGLDGSDWYARAATMLST
jgi:archaemetzincin